MEANTGFVAGPIASEQNHNTRCFTVSQGTEHVNLQALIYALLLTGTFPTLKEFNSHPRLPQTIPYPIHSRRDGTYAE